VLPFLWGLSMDLGFYCHFSIRIWNKEISLFSLVMFVVLYTHIYVCVYTYTKMHIYTYMYKVSDYHFTHWL